ncbi:polysaccharide lyase 8 family protein [Periweissella fabalis]|uniref:Polysaccharide lyase 8 family protein n=1 Tax=Periweissella fabalis TaxID=1070421 RepID=A0A7X6N4Z3_9LACO|nr:polysaccharide lyase 8 family protein [Periweissella fabalis]MCM0599875.1 polysaccharide lyase 8 family protein [Periweissella fabalis]NKZ24070.1 polysaccharide lyase 8 family protein [Periweissella fabalis]
MQFRNQKKPSHRKAYLTGAVVVLLAAGGGIIGYQHTHSNTAVQQTATNKYQVLQTNWQNQLIPSGKLPDNASSKAYVAKLNKQATELLRTMHLKGQDTLWKARGGKVGSANMTHQFNNLQTLALAYGTLGTQQYHDAKVLKTIVAGLDFMTQPSRYDGKHYSGNWFDWQIGTPQSFINILMILGNKLPKAEQQKYLKIIQTYVPNANQQLKLRPQDKNFPVIFKQDFKATAANRVDLASTVLGLGILQQNAKMITTATQNVVAVFKPVKTGDGFYRDGSFIQHTDVAYTGEYGNALIGQASRVLAVVKNTPFALPTASAEKFSNEVIKAFIPVLYQKNTLAMVEGRGVTRAPAGTGGQGWQPATMANLLLVADAAPKAQQTQLQAAVKYWVNKDPKYFWTSVRDYNDLRLLSAVESNHQIQATKAQFRGTKLYAAMGRFVQQSQKFSLGISLSSQRVASFEAGNGENKHGWHMGDGQLYLYNGDGIQYGESYWPTIDPYRLPGTTIDTKPLPNVGDGFVAPTPQNTWAGGVTNGNNAVISMALDQQGLHLGKQTIPMNLQAKKSWFMVDNQVVALGAGITGASNTGIETVGEDRLLSNEKQYQLLSDHGEIKPTSTVKDAKWLMLKAPKVQQSIGYYFPKTTTIEASQQIRTGRYADINKKFTNHKTYTGKYEKLIIKHGKNPVNRKYAYILVPNASRTKMQKLVQQNPIKILANDAQIQAVKTTNDVYLGINFWGPMGGELAGIKTNHGLALLRTKHAGITTYTFSDPTQSATQVAVKLPEKMAAKLKMSPGITYDSQTGEYLLNFTNLAGKALKISFK